MKSIRNSVKAIIIHNRHLLAIENEDVQGTWYILPGGGQEHGETFHEALRRECLEEIGTAVEIGPLRFIREYIGAHHEFVDRDADVHQIEFMFACTVPTDYIPVSGQQPDGMQTGVRWLDLRELAQHRFYPKGLVEHLMDYQSMGELSIYLGEMID